MRRSPAPTIGLALGVVLLVDVLRVWLPSIITIFGQAAATPAELLAAFALSWFLAAFAAPSVVRFARSGPVAVTAAVVLAGCRIALPATGGGNAQLYTASVGLLAALFWLAATAASTARPIPGLVLGLATATVAHTALGTYDLVWRVGIGTWALTVLAALAFVAATAYPLLSRRSGASRRAATTGGARSWLLFGPALLLSGMVAGSPALLRTGLSYTSGPGLPEGGGGLNGAIARQASSDVVLGTVLGAVALTAFVAGGLLARGRGGRWAGAVSLLAGAIAFAGTGPGGFLPGVVLVAAVVFTAAGLGACLGATDQPTLAETAPPALPATPPWALPAPPPSAAPSDPAQPSHPAQPSDPATPSAPAEATAARRSAARRGYAVVAGMLLFAVAAVAYYAAYDLGYPNQWVPVGVAVLVAVLAVSVRPAGASLPKPSPAAAVRDVSRRSARVRLVVAAALAGVLAGLAAPPPAPPAPSAPSEPGQADGPVRLVAYNIRMGFGLDGRFDLGGLARVIAGQEPDIVALSEVDRAWLLNGGHDTLALLARRLDMAYVFAPAADAVWGDAVLTRLPIRDARTVALPAVGAPTGAQALAVTLDTGSRELVVVATHLQPPPGGGPVAQATATARFATEFAAGRPLAVAGDLNTEPGEPAFEALRAAGLVDALAAARPLPTSPADDPAEEIDHVLVSPEVTVTGAAAPRSTASDHLPVAVTLTLPSA